LETGSLVFGDPIYVDKNSSEEEMKNKRLLLQESLNMVTTQAKELV
jgi:hypothetical protein